MDRRSVAGISNNFQGTDLTCTYNGHPILPVHSYPGYTFHFPLNPHHRSRQDHSICTYQFSVKISLRKGQTICDWLGFIVHPGGNSNCLPFSSSQLALLTMNCRAILVQPCSQYSRVSKTKTATSSMRAQLRTRANQLVAIVRNLYQYWMSPLSSSSSSQIEPWWQAVMGLVGPNFSTGMTFSATRSILTFPQRCPLKGVRKKLSELSLISVISMSLGFSMDFQCLACLTKSRSGMQLILLGLGYFSAPTKPYSRAAQFKNRRASFALQARTVPESVSRMMQALLLKMMVGGLKSLHSYVSCQISSLAASPPSWKVNCQLERDNSAVFIQNILNQLIHFALSTSISQPSLSTLSLPFFYKEGVFSGRTYTSLLYPISLQQIDQCRPCPPSTS